MTPRRALLDRLLVGLALLAIWKLASLLAGAYWISPPLATLQRLIAMSATGELPRHTGYTLSAAGIGFVLGGVPGALAPLVLRKHRFVQAVLEPFLVAGYGLPKLALAPLFILWFGIGAGSKVALVVSVVFFIVFFSTQAGVQSADQRLIRMARVIGASEAQLSRKVVWPAVVPFVFAGLRIATPYAIGGVIISELVSSNRGLGYLVQYAAMSFSTPDIFAVVAAITLLIAAATWLVGRLERRLLRWRPALAAEASYGGV
jgi:NitT/TauT family transport system permease protein